MFDRRSGSSLSVNCLFRLTVESLMVAANYEHQLDQAYSFKASLTVLINSLAV